MAITNSQRDLMMAKDKSILQKEIIRNDTNRRRRAAFQKTWRSPVHGFTPRPPTLEAMPSAAGMILGIAGSAVGAFAGGGQSNIFSQGGGTTTTLGTNTTLLNAPVTPQGILTPTRIV